MDKIAIICCYNNEQILNSMLEEGLQQQKNVQIQRIFYCNQFPSAASAYNDAILRSESDYMLFVHQDIKFLDEYFLEKLISVLKKNPAAIYGLCGAKYENGKTTTYSSVYHGLQNKIIGIKINTLQPADGLDEIFVAFHKSLTEKLRFDEQTFNGWHVFVEDLCLQAKENGLEIFVLPFKSQHKNAYEMPKYMSIYNLYPDEYFSYIIKLREKHYKNIDRIVCPCCTVQTRAWIFYPKIYAWRFRTVVKRWMRIISMG